MTFLCNWTAYNSSHSASSVKQYSSEAEMLQLTMDENQARCDFFKHFQYSTKDKLGTVRLKPF